MLTLTPQQQEILSSENTVSCWLLEFTIRGSTTRAHDYASYPLSVSDDAKSIIPDADSGDSLFYGLGSLMNVQSTRSELGVVSQTLEFQFLTPDTLPFRSIQGLGGEATLWRGFLSDSNDGEIIFGVVAFKGNLGSVSINSGVVSGKSLALTSISTSDQMQSITTPRPLRYTDADQQHLYPGDTSLLPLENFKPSATLGWRRSPSDISTRSVQEQRQNAITRL